MISEKLNGINIECDGCNSSTSHCVPTAGGNVVCACLPGFEDLDPINPGQNCSKLLPSGAPSPVVRLLITEKPANMTHGGLRSAWDSRCRG
ncbi:hypothetical protein NECAME_05638 [Necator americanus]|uniref:Uncharacterized protein n=1 Tax=Necator americanus TaxID=51031 RepID=W2SFH6_NECAM|nr:hypothetical protein NECAME_05638 [Necator americanus]ETN68364.1 hypothetical protein NECAME_05638 [Necator americanus]